MTALAAMPVLRVVAVRPGRQGPLNTGRPTNFEAVLGQIVGQFAPAPCRHCAGGYGPWTLCVVVPGHFGGSCANCHYGSLGTRCSLRKS